MGDAKPSLLFLFVQQDKESLEVSTNLKETFFLKYPAKNP